MPGLPTGQGYEEAGWTGLLRLMVASTDRRLPSLLPVSQWTAYRKCLLYVKGPGARRIPPSAHLPNCHLNHHTLLSHRKSDIFCKRSPFLGL